MGQILMHKMLMVGQQEGHPACKNWVVRYWCAYLSETRSNDLNMFQLMPLPPHFLLTKIRNGLPFWCWLSQVVLEKSLNGCSSVVLMHKMTALVQRASVPRMAAYNIRTFSILSLFWIQAFSRLSQASCEPCLVKTYCSQLSIKEKHFQRSLKLLMLHTITSSHINWFW